MDLDHLNPMPASVAYWYLRLVVIRNTSAICLLVGFLLLVHAPSTGALGAVGAALALGGFICWGLSVSVLVLPLVRSTLRGTHPSLSQVLDEINSFTGHSLIEQANESTGRSTPTITVKRARVLVWAEGVLFLLLIVSVAIG
ncbi:MAG TPA: hypothetical protein VNS19_23105 [Acidimicrobiales bacterium]|nr:hypothetical protein [Acidimicrobiales bacterium]